MDVDEDEEGSQSVKRIPDYGIEVDFDGLEDEDREVCVMYQARGVVTQARTQDGSAEALAEIDSQISKVNSEIERLAPNMKAMDRYE